MGRLGDEVLTKILSAIRAKLIELKADVDDELPDYIIVMVANKRTKTQMEKELRLFLNNNTAAFTNWLYAVLDKLNKVTLKKDTKIEAKNKKVKKVSKKPVKNKEKSEKEFGRLEGEDRGWKDNANLVELGLRRRKTKSSSGGLDSSGGVEGHNHASLLKPALGKTKKNKTSPKKSTRKRSSSSSSSSRREPSRREQRDRERVEGKESEDRWSRVKDHNMGGSAWRAQVLQGYLILARFPYPLATGSDFQVSWGT